MARNPWVETPRFTNEEIDAQIQEFLNGGGEIIQIPDNFKSIKTKTEKGIKIGKVYRQLEACKKS